MTCFFERYEYSRVLSVVFCVIIHVQSSVVLPKLASIVRQHQFVVESTLASLLTFDYNVVIGVIKEHSFQRYFRTAYL